MNLSECGVLFLDDEISILESIRRLTRKKPYQTFFCTSGEEALSLLENTPIHLVVSDMRMPEMTGDVFLAKVHEKYPDVNRFLLTGHSDIDAIVNALNDGGISKFLKKPWDEKEFLGEIEAALELSVLRQEHKMLNIKTKQQAKRLKELNATLEKRVEDRTKMLRRAFKQLDHSYGNFVKVFSYFISSQSHMIKGCSQEVALLCESVCNSLGITGADAKHIYYAALLHEVGKLSLSEDVLSRSEVRLTNRDLDEYRQYPLLGQMALSPVKVLEPAALIIRHHNELFDGSGYPDRLSGASIPIGSRILCVCRWFVGLQTEFLRTSPMSVDDAKNFLIQNKSKKFDPAVVDALLGLSLGKIDSVRSELVLSVKDLRPGMKLVRDLVTDRGVLLISSGNYLSEQNIHKLRQMCELDSINLMAHVLSEVSSVEGS
ncbi:HD domain-containing phosphohydrolase [Marinobacter sp. NSM]|uniref:HD domain-containing phosphohydrolase n=1 Tax=Marinobacter sp. NSM TaxID=3458004 RepID=UPI0040356FB4